MKTVILDVRTPTAAGYDFLSAWKSVKAQRSARISFATPEPLWRVPTAKCWGFLKAMCGAGPLTVRESARRVDRDAKSDHTDLTALLNAAVPNRAQTGQVVFPYASVTVEFLLQAA